jgi:hypothetical protein
LQRNQASCMPCPALCWRMKLQIMVRTCFDHGFLPGLATGFNNFTATGSELLQL